VEGVGLNESEGTGRVKLAGAGGKGGGGRWLFVSHEPVEMSKVKVSNFSSFLGMQRTGQVVESGRQFTEERLIHFKFEPMVSASFVTLSYFEFSSMYVLKVLKWLLCTKMSYVAS
jgi:hypothetical protein